MPMVTTIEVRRRDHESHTPEAEILAVERHGSRVLLILDDGASLDMDADELATAILGSRGGRASDRRAA